MLISGAQKLKVKLVTKNKYEPSPTCFASVASLWEGITLRVCILPFLLPCFFWTSSFSASNFATLCQLRILWVAVFQGLSCCLRLPWLLWYLFFHLFFYFSRFNLLWGFYLGCILSNFDGALWKKVHVLLGQGVGSVSSSSVIFSSSSPSSIKSSTSSTLSSSWDGSALLSFSTFSRSFFSVPSGSFCSVPCGFLSGASDKIDFLIAKTHVLNSTSWGKQCHTALKIHGQLNLPKVFWSIWCVSQHRHPASSPQKRGINFWDERNTIENESEGEES